MKRSYGISKIVLWCTAVICVGIMCLSLSSCGMSEEDSGYNKSLYAGEIQEADVFIDIPNLRQYGSYTCGTTYVQMLMNWIAPYDGDLNLTAYEEELGTSEEDGTPPENIIGYFEESEVKTAAEDKLSVDDLVSALDRGHPVMMCIQAWSSAEDDNTDTYLTEGRWVICVGYQNQKDGYIFYFNDPACVGYCIMSEDDLDDRWIDMDAKGNIYDHYGIEICEDVKGYDPDGVFYLE